MVAALLILRADDRLYRYRAAHAKSRGTGLTWISGWPIPGAGRTGPEQAKFLECAITAGIGLPHDVPLHNQTAPKKGDRKPNRR